ncbi:hypothetical protein [Pleionea sediminis]|uniref:hypothetical protein n=1 Tax=Pleionea sediminis TaxID=2569479 RepID=UPI00118682D8|nr:hypothetical protein [Pleionea sediminis]
MYYQKKFRTGLSFVLIVLSGFLMGCSESEVEVQSDDFTTGERIKSKIGAPQHIESSTDHVFGKMVYVYKGITTEAIMIRSANGDIKSYTLGTNDTLKCVLFANDIIEKCKLN